MFFPCSAGTSSHCFDIAATCDILQRIKFRPQRSHPCSEHQAILCNATMSCRTMGSEAWIIDYLCSLTPLVCIHVDLELKRANQSPVGMVELLDQLAAVSKSDLNVSDRLGGVKFHWGAGLGFIGSLVLLGSGWCRNQLWSGTGGWRRKPFTVKQTSVMMTIVSAEEE